MTGFLIENSQNYTKKEWNRIKGVTTFTLFVGLALSGIILGCLVHFYQEAYKEEREDERLTAIRNVDIAGLVTIIIVGMLYWIVFSKMGIGGVCLSEEITQVWPHLAFRYGLGLGVFLPLLKLVPKRISNTTDNYHSNLEEYFPLLIISLIMGSYAFMLMQWLFIGVGPCRSYLMPQNIY